MAGRLRDLLYERGVSTVRLQVVAKNADSLAFWQSLGYEPLEVILEREPSEPGARGDLPRTAG
jgi:hypothetical protein